MKKLITISLVSIMFLVASVAQAIDIGPFVYSNGTLGQKDTVTIAELYYQVGASSLVGKYVYISTTADLAAPMNQACQILKYSATSGSMIVDTASDASIGFSANLDNADVVWIMDQPPSQALIRKSITATKVATGVAPLDYLLYLTNSADSADVAAEYVRSHIDDVESDCDTTELRVQQMHVIINNLRDSLATLSSGSDSVEAWIGTATGIGTYPAAVAPGTNGSNAFEGLRAIYDKIDSLRYEFNSTRGITTDPTGLFHAAGVSEVERINFLLDSLRKVHTSTDSILAYLHSATGAPAVTGAFPAAGLSLLERIQFLADSLRKVGVSTDSIWSYMATATGAQWGTPAEPANGVNILEGLGYMQNQLDSLIGALYGDVGLQWSAGAAPANGVSETQVLRATYELIDTEIGALRDSLEDANDHLQRLRGVNAGFTDENVWQTVEVIVNFAAAGAWEDAATTHELFATTGDVEYEISAFCSTDVAVTSADSIFFITDLAGDVGAYRCMGTDIDAGEGLFRGINPTVLNAVIPTATQLAGAMGGKWSGTIFGGHDIGFDIDDHDFTGGIIVFYCRWRPITTGGTVAAGTGASL